MYTLPDRFEFLSDAWIDEARRFLERACEQRKAELAPFSLSERFADAPPHPRCRTTSAPGPRATTARR